MTDDNIVDIRIYRLRRLNEDLAVVRETRKEAAYHAKLYRNLAKGCKDEENRLVEMIREINEEVR